MILSEIKKNGLFKEERIINSSQQIQIKPKDFGEVLNFCSNNYLGLSSNETVIKNASKILKSHGFGLSSVRFICGTQDIHKELEKKIVKNSEYNYKTFLAKDIDDTFHRATNAEMYHWIKDNLDFDQMIWVFGNDDNPDWVHVSYVSPEENRKRCLKAFREDGKTKYSVI